MSMLKQLRHALANLRPEEVRQTADRQLAVGLVSSSAAGYTEMEKLNIAKELHAYQPHLTLARGPRASALHGGKEATVRI
jgi:transposase